MSRFGKTRKKVAQRIGRGPNPDKVMFADREVNDPNALSAEDLKTKSQGARAGLQGLTREAQQTGAGAFDEKRKELQKSTQQYSFTPNERWDNKPKLDAAPASPPPPQPPDDPDDWYSQNKDAIEKYMKRIEEIGFSSETVDNWYNKEISDEAMKEYYEKVRGSGGGNFGVPDGKTVEEFFEELINKKNEFPEK